MVEKLVVVDISPIPRRASSSKVFFKAIRSVAVPKELTLSEAKAMANEQLKTVLMHQLQRDFVLNNLTKTENGRYCGTCLRAFLSCPNETEQFRLAIELACVGASL